MTDTTNAYEVGTTVHVAPESLLMNRNVREAQPDPGLTRSVKALGVLEPITAVVTEEGALLVRYGHRRTLAAVEAGTPTVPVYVTGADSTEKEAEVVRIVSQRDENTHRVGLNTSEEIGVVEQLTLLGLSAAQVAKQGRIKRGDVDAALTVSGSEIARKAAQRYDALTLEQAATVAEFEDEDSETIKALLIAAVEGGFEHVAQQARDRRTDAQARTDVLAALEAEGVKVVERPSYDDSKTLPLSRLHASAETRRALTLEEHATCPGHVGWVDTDWVRVDATGKPVAEPERPVDDDDEQAREAYREASSRFRATTRQVQRPCAAYGCTGWKSHAHLDLHNYGSTSSTRPKAAEMSDAERAEAKTERRLVIENNKAWSSSEPVRREFLATLAKTKTPPKGTSRFLACVLCLDPSTAATVGGNALAAEWLNVKNTGYGWADLSPAKSATEPRSLVVALIQVLGGYEAAITKDSWRHDGTHNSTGRYLRFLASCGYDLSEVEKYAVSKKTA